MRRFIAAAVTTAAVAVPLAAVGGSAEAATKHHVIVAGTNAAAKPTYKFTSSSLKIYAGAFKTVKTKHGDKLAPAAGVQLCLEHKLAKKGQPWKYAHKDNKKYGPMVCQTTPKSGNVTLTLRFAPDADWYYRVVTYSSKYSGKSKAIYPVYKG